MRTCSLRLQSQRDQYALDRQLIAALVKNDDPQALRLVNRGADPNAPYKPRPAPSVQQLVSCLFRRSPLPVNDSPTAFSIVCGEFRSVKDEGVFLCRNDVPELAQTMLQHGARENGKGVDGWTPLFFAIVNRRPKTVEILLKHRVAINATTKHGVSALNIAVLYHKETPTVVPLLLAYGADPNLPDDRGATAVQQAKNAHRLGLVSLLQRAGAKK